MANICLNTDIKELSGVGKSRATALGKLGIFTVRDLIYFFPRAYEKRCDERELKDFDENENRSYVLTVATRVTSAQIKRGLTVSKFRAFDESGSVEITFFNSPYIKDVFHVGDVFRFYGKVTRLKSKIQMTNPKYEAYRGGELRDYISVYHLTSGLTSKVIGNLVKSALNDVYTQIIDPLPEYIRLEKKLTTLQSALKSIHFPEDDADINSAIRRLAFDEMMLFALGISMSANYKISASGIKFTPCSITPLTDLLPYELTSSQKHAINDIYRDTVHTGTDEEIHPMARIIVGDVGSGKTICAIAAMYIAARSGCQSALMVPTEILARQHYADVSELMSKLGIRTALLIGATSAKEKRRIYAAMESGEVDIVIGTHALISDGVSFARLGLIITDEQHRFGVAQRGVLKERTENAHLLVMSATPIPRTLALAMYGDLDISKITEMPKGRQKTDTFVVDESYRARLTAFIKRQVDEGGQCYIVCPSIEPEEGVTEIFTPEGVVYSSMRSERSLNLKNAVEYTDNLRSSLPDLKIECLHGRMSGADKDNIMSRFSAREIDVLVSTTVIEVGVNVPNASLMIVENAERFGLAQLHQLRGRVGRGQRKSYCILVSDMKGEKAQARLNVMKSTNDGFEIAEHDLMQRGPGDFFASADSTLRQSGGFEFKFAGMCDDRELFESAFATAKYITERDNGLKMSEHIPLKHELERRMRINISTIS